MSQSIVLDIGKYNNRISRSITMVKCAITLKWSVPIPIGEAIDDPDFISSGVYCIIRKYGSNMNLYYVGKSAGVSVRGRLKKHQETTVKGKKGEKMVSFARVSKDDVGDMNLKSVIDDIESLLIYDAQPEYNIQKKCTLNVKNDFILKNAGHKFPFFKPSIDSGKLMIESKSNPKKPKMMKRKDDDDWFGW